MSHTVRIIIIDQTGEIIQSDDDFSTMIRAPRSLTGANVLAITAPGDRERCTALLEQICADGKSISTTKRLIRADGSPIWVNSHLASIGQPGQPRIEISIEESQSPSGWVEPAKLLEVARLTLTSRRGRAATFGEALFSDHAWDVLLAAYIREAEGSTISIAQLHAGTGITLATGSRWIRALSSEGLVEYEDGGNHELVTTPFRLSAMAHRKLEAYLSGFYENAASARVFALGS